VKKEDLEKEFAALAPQVALIAMTKFGMSRDDAADAVQQAYVRLFDRLDDPFRDPDVSLRQYMIGAVRSFASHQREHARVRGRAEGLLWRTLTPEPVVDPETELMTAEQRARLWQAIERLKEPSRSIFTLLVGKEMGVAEIAGQLDLDKKAIYGHYARGIRRLRKILTAA